MFSRKTQKKRGSKVIYSPLITAPISEEDPLILGNWLNESDKSISSQDQTTDDHSDEDPVSSHCNPVGYYDSSGRSTPDTEPILNYRDLSLELIQPRLNTQSYQGTFYLNYQFLSPSLYQQYRSLLPKKDQSVGSGSWLPFLRNQETQQVKQILNYHQFMETISLIEKERIKNPTLVRYLLNVPSKGTGKKDYSVGSGGEIDFSPASESTVDQQVISLRMTVNLKYQQLPIYQDSSWVREQFNRMNKKYRLQAWEIWKFTSMALENLIKFLFLFQSELEQLQEVGQIYNGLVNINCLQQLMELYHQLIPIQKQINCFRIPSIEWSKCLYQREEYGFQFDLNVVGNR